MLEALQNIVQQVNRAANVEAALASIVDGVRSAMQVQQCSIYLVDADDGHLVLTATNGLNQAAVGNVRLARGEGLIGTVGKQQYPLVVADAAADQRFRYVPLTGEERFRAFLGVPMIHLSRLIGVLAVQTTGVRTFVPDDEAFLVTISAQLAGIVQGAALGERVRAKVQGAAQLHLQGVASAPGIAVGIPVPPSEMADLDQVPDRGVTDAPAEERRFLQAITDVRAEFHDSGQRFSGVLPGDALELFDVYAQLAGDPDFIRAVTRRIRAGTWAPAALRDTVSELSARFEAIADARLQARGEDLRAVGRRILLWLHPDARNESEYPDRCILVGTEVSIARIASVPIDKLAGIVCLAGSVHSHTAIFARSLGVPAVMGLGALSVGILDSGMMAVDGYRGRVVVNPSPPVRAEFLRLEREEREFANRVNDQVLLDARTADGIRLPVVVSLALLADIDSAVRMGAEGVGLYRTEFPFMVREAFPVEEEQVAIYAEVLAAFPGEPVVMRTLDIGGDKPLPYFPLHDANPSLGSRGIRVSLQHPEIFVTQIRAMLRANARHGNLHILLPMVSHTGEVVRARALIAQAHAELRHEGLDIPLPPLGAMIEVPAILYQLPTLCRSVDFLSLGSNDLTQYLMAADRDNPNVADLYDHLQPAVLLAIGNAIREIHVLGRKVTLCGELGADPLGVILALGMGVDGISVSPSALGKAKWVIRSFRSDEAAELYARSIEHNSAAEVRVRLTAALEERGLGGLVRAGK